MKQQWRRIAAKIDAMKLSERLGIFFMAALILVALFFSMFLDPEYAQQKQVLQRLSDDRAQIASMQAEIAQKTTLQGTDPDKADKDRLQQMRKQAKQMRDTLLSSQKSLVSPDKMPALLESMLKHNRNLRLISLRTLETVSLADAAAKNDGKNAAMGSPAAAGQGKSSPSGMDAVYNHAVEVTVKGSYFDIMNYLEQLEAMPWQLYWGKADFQVAEYPDAVMILTVSTMSLDKKWLDL